ncbi:MAG: hypothetical protein PHU66_05725 [Bacteroidaceae bacterium]|jgi:hypothetical protein|nr:hypothetical protein [Bacteroidaceae bacterium]
MFDKEELESWHEDLSAWERYQDELEKINGENRQIHEVLDEDHPSTDKCKIKKNG